MKRQKSPVVLVTVLVVIIGVALGARFFNPEALKSGQQAPPDTVAGDTRSTESADDIRSKVKASTGALASDGSSTTASGEVGPLAEASILEPEAVIHKPAPNDSTISTQWYDENSRKAAGN